MNTAEFMSDRFDHSQYVSMTMEFRCNLKCVHCMIEGTMDHLIPESRQRFDELLTHNAEHKQWRGLILTGSEITLMRDLPELAQRAKESGFEHVRIQTHGMHLGQPSYCKTLIDAGVDEFFVSVAGSNAHTHDMITTVNGSFERTVKGLEHIDQYDHAISITNTVITKNSYKQLPDLVRRLAHLEKLIQMEFWTYWPMKEHDEKDLIARHSDILPYLKEAIALARESGRRVEVKNFPQCLLGDEGSSLVNSQPLLYIDDNFWDEFARNGFYQCVYREQCASKECLGLNSAYIEKYGLEQDALSPIKTEKA